MAELVKKFDVHANQITDWKKQLLFLGSASFCAYKAGAEGGKKYRVIC